MKNNYRTRIQKVGNSLAIFIPKSLADAHGFKRGDEVIFGHVDNTTLAVRKMPDLFYQEIKPK